MNINHLGCGDERVNRSDLLKRILRISAMASVLLLGGCATMPGWISADGPSREQVQTVSEEETVQPGIQVLTVHDKLARKLLEAKKLDEFSKVFKQNAQNQYLVGPGDILEVSVWEAPPALLFGSMAMSTAGEVAASHVSVFPEQMVAANGTISIPFAGYIPVSRRTAQQIEAEIVKRLTGKANLPQVIVRVIKNNSATVTVVGDVNNSARIPLTPMGERLLDAVAAGGGTKEAIKRMAIQLSRGKTTATMALDSIIRNPQQNITLQPGDVVTALYQPKSFTVLGATGSNAEVEFEAKGISLAQALARSGGLDDNRADARGVFVFRFEDASLVDDADLSAVDLQGRVPVVYEVNLRDPGSLFVVQNFPIDDQDVLYVANAPSAEITKFLRMIGSVLSPAMTVQSAAR
ncbi:polysaccharide biosynthesis/export family protein [Orrella sp. 11846]|uniref:polysaccharide biosynthesis/export family protein n=1 Tax=Orrella sp. 11846 TaxID=3409913 RepID=UPI003B5BE7E4